MVIKTRYGGSMIAHADYIQRHGKLETFGPNNPNDFKDFVNRLNKQIKQDGKTDLMMRKFIISPDPRLDLSDDQMKEITQEVMADLQTHHGNFNWYAVIHRDTNTPHVHVIAFGQKSNLVMRKADIDAMRERLGKIDYRMKGVNIEIQSDYYKFKGVAYAMESGLYAAQRAIFQGKFSRAQGGIEKYRKQKKDKGKRKKKIFNLRRRRWN